MVKLTKPFSNEWWKITYNRNISFYIFVWSSLYIQFFRRIPFNHSLHVVLMDWPLVQFHLRATSHMSQEHWPCNGEDPWLSSKGRTMGVGKALLCSHGPSSIVWSENGPCCGTITYFVGGKEGRIWFNTICLKLYQFKRNIWWCLSVMESIMESVMDYALQFVLKFVMLCKILKNHGLPEFSSDPPLGGGPDPNSGRPCTLIHSPPCRTPCRLVIHGFFWGPFTS
jgi:hypothetical protein